MFVCLIDSCRDWTTFRYQIRLPDPSAPVDESGKSPERIWSCSRTLTHHEMNTFLSRKQLLQLVDQDIMSKLAQVPVVRDYFEQQKHD